MRHVVVFLALGICSAQTVPPARATTGPEGDVRRPVDADASIISKPGTGQPPASGAVTAFSADGAQAASAGDDGAICHRTMPFAAPFGSRAAEERGGDSVQANRSAHEAAQGVGVPSGGCNSAQRGHACGEQKIELLARRTSAFPLISAATTTLPEPKNPLAIRRDYNEQHGASHDSGPREESGAVGL